MQVAEALKTFKQYHNSDPRPFLNTYFWSVLIKYKFCDIWDNCPPEITKWCQQQFDKQDWVMLGRKIWFTNQNQYAQFWLTWEEYLDKD